MRQEIYEEALKRIVRRIQNSIVTNKGLLLREIEEIAQEALKRP